MTSILDTAVAWHEAGYHILPVKTDGSKGPALPTWKQHQARKPTAEELLTWCASAQGIGVLTGTPAGLEMLEAEGRAVDAGQLNQLADLAEASGLADLWQTVANGYCEVTPAGGIHWYYLVDGPMRGNTKLARRPGPDGKPEVMWETRGEGGFSIIAPSAGTTHPTGRGWDVRHGTVAGIPTITANERDALHALCSMLDEMPAAAEQERAQAAPRTTTGAGLRPGDDFNQRATWDEILTGWTKVRRMGSGWGWLRPGKSGTGISATTGQSGDGADRLYVFSTSTEFESERPYSKFAAWALLNCGGSYQEAARALAAQGYGDPPIDIEWLSNLATPPAKPNAARCGDPCDPPKLRAVPDPEPEPGPPTLADELAADRLLAEEVALVMRRERAREIVSEIKERTHPKPKPDAGTITELLARPEANKWRIDGLLPAGGRMLFVAQRKTGKTTAVGNLSRALIEGSDCLGRFPTAPLSGRIVVLNYEVTGAQFARWMHEVGVPGDRMYAINLRGCANPLASEAGRAELVDLIREQSGEVLIVDPFGRAYTGRDQNDAALITPWLVNLDQVAEMSGCTELILTAHAGWNGERTRGSSALEDWPDVIVTMTKDAETAQRYLRAEGRDVDIDEDRLEYDELTRSYSFAGEGSKAGAAERRQMDKLVDALADTVARNPGKGLRALFRIMRDDGVPWASGVEAQVSREAEKRGLVEVRMGANRSRLHYPTGPGVSGVSGVSEVYPRSDSSVSYRGDTGLDTKDTETAETPAGPDCVVCGSENPNRYGAGGSAICTRCRPAAGGR